MFEPIASLLGALISALQSVRLSERRKRQLGKHLRRVHNDLEQLVSNGRSILNRLDRHRKNNTIDIDSLMRQLLDQQLLITRILSALRTRDCRNTLRIKVPRIGFLCVALQKKGSQITVLLDATREFDDAARLRYRSGHAYEPSAVIGMLTWNPPKFDAPPLEAVKASRKALKKIEQLNDELREFLASSFDVEHLL